MRTNKKLLALVMSMAGVLALSGCAPSAAGEAKASIVGLPPGAEAGQYARAYTPRQFSFPADHGAHKEYQTEWWYYTGNMQSAAGRQFGYQLTIFRRALAPPGAMATAASTFSTDQLYLAHFALTDVQSKQHVAFEKYSRGAAGLAGAATDPFAVTIEDWSVKSGLGGNAGNGPQSVRISAQKDGYAIALDLHTDRQPVLQGNKGLSQKSPTPGNASYYYSFTRIDTKGAVRTPEGETAVTGQSWFDHEWSTSALGENVRGWDWLAIQLDNGAELMLYQLRTANGGTGESSAGTYIDAQGKTSPVVIKAGTLTPLRTWRSPRRPVDYPVEWRVELKDLDMTLQIRAKVDDQEMNLKNNYWEGAIDITGTHAGAPISGVGYLELTGYDQTYNGVL